MGSTAAVTVALDDRGRPNWLKALAGCVAGRWHWLAATRAVWSGQVALTAAMRPHAAAAALAAVALSLLVRPGSGINNGLARTPPMTWSSWGSFGCGVSEQHIRDTADDFVRLGLVEAGYSILQIDDCWSNKTHRAADGSLMANRTKFPSGTLAPVAKYVESKGLQLGIYTDLGVHTCAGYPGSGGPKNPDGSYGHYCQDAQTFADWGIHYIKQDFCGPRPGNCGTSDDAGGKACYTIMSECIAKTKKPIIFGLCSWGSDQPWTYGPAIANLWRTTADQQPLWESIMRSVDNQLVALSSAGPGGWNDMDELFMVGSGKENGRDHGSCLALSFVERQSMFNFWTMFAAPLAIGDDVGKLLGNSSSAVEARGLYTNKEVSKLLACVPLSFAVSSMPSGPISDRLFFLLFGAGHRDRPGHAGPPSRQGAGLLAGWPAVGTGLGAAACQRRCGSAHVQPRELGRLRRLQRVTTGLRLPRPAVRPDRRGAKRHAFLGDGQGLSAVCLEPHDSARGLREQQVSSR